MGLVDLDASEHIDSSAKKTFSNDVLKIEICGPEQLHLSVIDVPGIFRKTTSGVTTKTDMELVKNMVLGYMKNPRSAMLTVIPANVDIGTQEIIEMAEECDPKGERTLGVLTKPDLVDEGTERHVVDIVQGKIHRLHLGWCILRNPGQSQLGDGTTERHEREREFFSSRYPWDQIAKDRVGVLALQNRLVAILTDLVRREFPDVRSDINKRVRACRKEMLTLGNQRETSEQQCNYLLELSARFQDVASLALKAHYGSDEIFSNSPGLRLATAIVDRNDRFSEDVDFYGHTRAFKDNLLLGDPTIDHTDDQLIDVCYVAEDSELDDFIPDEIQIARPRPFGTKRWLEEIYKNSRGYALGTFDVSLLSIAWKEQSSKWDALAVGYITDVVGLIHGFIGGLLQKVCHDKRVEVELRSVLLDKLLERYKRAVEHTRFLLSVERTGTPMTTNHYFAENLEKLCVLDLHILVEVAC